MSNLFINSIALLFPPRDSTLAFFALRLASICFRAIGVKFRDLFNSGTSRTLLLF
jgi:hypothetical protein